MLRIYVFYPNDARKKEKALKTISFSKLFPYLCLFLLRLRKNEVENNADDGGKTDAGNGEGTAQEDRHLTLGDEVKKKGSYTSGEESRCRIDAYQKRHQNRCTESHKQELYSHKGFLGHRKLFCIHSRYSLLVFQTLLIPVEEFLHTILNLYLMRPSEAVELINRDELAHGSIWLAGVKLYLAFETYSLYYKL